jgi:hypothetical protein
MNRQDISHIVSTTALALGREPIKEVPNQCRSHSKLRDELI